MATSIVTFILWISESVLFYLHLFPSNGLFVSLIRQCCCCCWLFFLFKHSATWYEYLFRACLLLPLDKVADVDKASVEFEPAHFFLSLNYRHIKEKRLVVCTMAIVLNWSEHWPILFHFFLNVVTFFFLFFLLFFFKYLFPLFYPWNRPMSQTLASN